VCLSAHENKDWFLGQRNIFLNFILFFVHHSQPKSNQVFRETIIQFIFFVPENIKRKKIQFFILFLEENKALKLLLETQ